MDSCQTGLPTLQVLLLFWWYKILKWKKWSAYTNDTPLWKADVCLGAGHFGHKTLRHHKIGAEAEVSVHFGTGTEVSMDNEVSIGHFSTVAKVSGHFGTKGSGENVGLRGGSRTPWKCGADLPTDRSACGAIVRACGSTYLVKRGCTYLLTYLLISLKRSCGLDESTELPSTNQSIVISLRITYPTDLQACLWLQS